MSNFTTKQGALFYCYTIPSEQVSKINAFLEILEKSGVAKVIKEAAKLSDFGRPGFNPYLMFAAIIYGFAVGAPSLRELETSCRYDIRFMYIMNEIIPDHSTFSRFINTIIRPNKDELFSLVVKAYFEHCHLDMEDCHLDGTKFEARPNKYKVVWKPTTFHRRLCNNARNLINELGLSNGMPAEEIYPSKVLAEKVEQASALAKTIEEKDQKVFNKKLESLTHYLSKAVEYEEKERICGDNRSSYYKTDHDATAMCLKEDYYSGLGSNMHAAYQMQSMVCHGFIVSYYVSQDRTDLYTLIPSVERFHEMYGKYPKTLTADSGYGALKNYKYCQEKGIEAYIKYQAWTGESSGRNPAIYELNPDNTITCLGGKTGVVVDYVPNRHHKLKDAKFYRIECDSDCPFMPYCRRYMKEPKGEERIFEINQEYQTLRQEARDRLLSVKGIELRVNRSCQIEGVYGIEKFNMKYNRIRRIGLDRVTTEYMLTALGLNTRKILRFIDGKTDFKYWKAPDGLEPEKFKKPSAKRLANRVNKRRNRQPNEIAKRSYHYKFRAKHKN